ncbi:type IV pilus modification PilV family protein [Sporosarcina sp. CAU 1771]
MTKHKHKTRMNENGLSLVEVVASIVILTLLITTFMMMFLQSAKTNKASEEIVDATYIAQTEMENIYSVRKINGSISDEAIDTAIKSVGYPDPPSTIVENGREWFKYKKEIVNENIRIELRLEKTLESMKFVIIEAYETAPKNTPRAKMQNLIVWEVNQP